MTLGDPFQLEILYDSTTFFFLSLYSSLQKITTLNNERTFSSHCTPATFEMYRDIIRLREDHRNAQIHQCIQYLNCVSNGITVLHIPFLEAAMVTHSTERANK